MRGVVADSRVLSCFSCFRRAKENLVVAECQNAVEKPHPQNVPLLSKTGGEAQFSQLCKTSQMRKEPDMFAYLASEMSK